ncbi:CAP-Gly domain-containing linker protein 4 [Trebouxia sp. C0010 RCD-2024]
MGNSPSLEYWNWPWAPADEILIDAIENVGRCQRSDHIKKAINYVKILLEKQAEPNARDEWGSGSALHYAIWCGQLEVVKLLLDTGTCNIEADTGQYFRGYDQYIRPIHMAAYEARPDLMRLLIANGASIDAPDRKGRTPVQCVLAPTFFDGESLMGKPTKTTLRQRLTLQLLVEKGADVNRPFTTESLPAIPFKHLVTQCPSPLHLACDRGDTELVKVLLGGYKVDINGENCPNAASPLQIAVERKDLELVKILKNAGANAELARLTIATKLQHLKRTSGSSPGAASSSSNADTSPSNGFLRTPEQTVPPRTFYASPATPSDHASSADPKGKRSNPSLHLHSSPTPSPPEITAASEEDVKGKRSLWPPPTPVTRAGVPPSGDKRSLSRHARRGSSDSLCGGKQEQRDSDMKLDNHDSEAPRKFGRERRDSSEDLRRANSNMGRLASSRSTDLLLAQV